MKIHILMILCFVCLSFVACNHVDSFDAKLPSASDVNIDGSVDMPSDLEDDASGESTDSEKADSDITSEDQAYQTVLPEQPVQEGTAENMPDEENEEESSTQNPAVDDHVHDKPGETEDSEVECQSLSLCLDDDTTTLCCSPEPIPIEAEGLPNLFQLSEILYRSGQPVEQGLTSAKALGIKTVLSLQLVNADTTYEAEENTGLTLEHVSMVPWYVSTEQLIEVMQKIDQAEKPVLVHCLHGSDRTGLIVALYRILYEGWTREMAVYEMTEGGFGYHDAFSNLVETLETVDLEVIRSAVFGDAI